MDGPDSPESHETTPENEVPSPLSQPSCSEEHHDEPVEDNWIKKATCVADRLAYAVETGVLADVVFLVGLTEERAEKIPAHRCILSFGSTVFKDLLTQSNNQQDIPLRVDDLDPQAFRNVLRYLYTDKVSVSGETVIGTMYAAKKYDLPLLQAECDAYLKNNVTAENCLRWLMQFQSYGDVDLAMTYAKDIDRYAAAVLRSPLFLDLEHDLLCMLLARDTLAAPEKDIFAAVERWGQEQCMRQNLEPTGENMRAVLQEAVYLVRYPLLSLQDLALGPAKAGWLSSDEINQLVQHHFGHSSLPERFITTPRVGISIAGRVRRFGGEKVSRCTFPTRPDFVGFSVPRDARVSLVAVGYYGSGMDTTFHGTLTFKLFKQKEQIAPPPATSVSQSIPPGRFWGPGRSRRHRDRGRDDEERGGRDGDGRSDHWERGGARLDQQPPSPPMRNESPKIIVKTVYEQTFRLEGMGSRTEPVIIRLQLAEPVYIEPDANYVLFAKLSQAQGLTNCWFGEKSFHCADAAGLVNLRSVTFWTAKNPEGSQETNGTNVFGGQFPELYFQNCEMGGGDARATLVANAV